MSKKKLQSKFNSLFIINSILAVCLVIALGFLTIVYLDNEELQEKHNQQLLLLEEQEQQQSLQEEQDLKRLEEEARYFEEKTKAMEIEFTDEKNIVEKKVKKRQVVFHYNDKEETVIKEKKKYTPPPLKKRPKLVIIIDDVTTASQIQKIKNIPFPITMSFLPPISRHKNSAKITKNLKNYMIHLPLEAQSRRYEEDNTLHIEDSYKKINKRIKYLKKLYPKAKYINNHTGSKFTKNKQAMDKLFRVLKQYNYFFVDSKTTSKTATKQYAKKYNLKYLTRNVFLDNKREKRYIIGQLRKSIKIAKRDGFAIAIGHPHNITLKTLSNSKYLLKDLEVVYVHQLSNFLK